MSSSCSLSLLKPLNEFRLCLFPNFDSTPYPRAIIYHACYITTQVSLNTNQNPGVSASFLYFWSGPPLSFRGPAAEGPQVRDWSAVRDGAGLRDRAGIEWTFKWQLDPVGCQILARWRQECWDVALSRSKTLTHLFPVLLGTLARLEFRVGWTSS